MSETKNNRGWICALVAVAFFAVGISGLMMLLHLAIPLDVKPLHVVMGIAFIVAGVIHLVLNWRTFTAHFRNRPAIIASAAALAIVAALLFAGGGTPDNIGAARDRRSWATGRAASSVMPDREAQTKRAPATSNRTRRFLTMTQLSFANITNSIVTNR